MKAYEIKNFHSKYLKRKTFKDGEFIYLNQTVWSFVSNNTEKNYSAEDLFKYDDFEEYVPIKINIYITNEVGNPFAIINKEGQIIARIIPHPINQYNKIIDFRL